MKVISHDNAAAFLDRVGPLLRQSESTNNLTLGLAEQIVRSGTPTFKSIHDNRTDQPATAVAPESPLLLCLEDNGKVFGSAMLTTLRAPMILGGFELNFSDKQDTELRQCLKELCEWLTEQKINVSESVGFSRVSKAFKSVFADHFKLSARLTMDQGVYELRELIMPENPKALTVQAFGSDDLATVIRYKRGFITDCFPEKQMEDSDFEVMAQKRLEAGGLWLLKDSSGTPLSMAAVNRETSTGSTVSWIYTPNELRGHGYASLATALVSKQELEKGKTHCSLFTDLNNPTSNSIYQKIGYRKVAESQHYAFE